jgi:hypothetical protein
MNDQDRALANASHRDLLIDSFCCCISFEILSTFPNQQYPDINAKFMIKTENSEVSEINSFE